MLTLRAPTAALIAFLLLAACTSRTESTPPAGGAGHDAPAGSAKVWFEGSYEDALAQAKATDKLVFVDFWTSWCGFCKKLDKLTFSRPEVQAELARMVSVSIDAESKAGAPVAQRYHVSGYPTLLVVDATGKEIGRIAGFLEPAPFLAKLDEIRARLKTAAR